MSCPANPTDRVPGREYIDKIAVVGLYNRAWFSEIAGEVSIDVLLVENFAKLKVRFAVGLGDTLVSWKRAKVNIVLYINETSTKKTGIFELE